MFLGRIAKPLVIERLERGGDSRPRVARNDNLVHVAKFRGLERIGEGPADLSENAREYLYSDK